MEQYFIITANDNPSLRATVNNSWVEEAKNIDNLRKNLAKKLINEQIVAVYSGKGHRFYGMFASFLVDNTIAWRTKDGKIHKSTWPKYLWVANNREYAVNSRTGKIRAIPKAKRRM